MVEIELVDGVGMVRKKERKQSDKPTNQKQTRKQYFDKTKQ